MHYGEMGRVAAALAIASGLAACGGGGGGTSAATEQTAGVAITETNAPSVAAEAVDAGGSGVAGQAGLLTGVEVSAAGSARGSIVDALTGAVRLALRSKAAPALVGATVSDSVQCSGGGNIALSATVASESGPTPGDRVDFTFNACVEHGATANGALSLAFVSLDAAQTLIVADLKATQFTSSHGSIGERLNGDARITIDQTDAAKLAVTMASGALSMDRLQAGIVRATRSLTDYHYRLETTLATGSSAETFSYTASGTFPRIGNVSFTAQTTQPVITAAGAVYPSAGAGKVSGANGSSLAITVTGSGLQLDVDRNGDSVVDATVLRTWAQLDDEL
jgi:hypothetical protein